MSVRSGLIRQSMRHMAQLLCDAYNLKQVWQAFVFLFFLMCEATTKCLQSNRNVAVKSQICTFYFG